MVEIFEEILVEISKSQIDDLVRLIKTRKADISHPKSDNLFQSKPIKVSHVEFQSGSWLFVGLSADKIKRATKFCPQ